MNDGYTLNRIVVPLYKDAVIIPHVTKIGRHYSKYNLQENMVNFAILKFIQDIER